MGAPAAKAANLFISRGTAEAMPFPNLLSDKLLVGGWAQDFADFAGQVLEGEGFLQECFLAVGGGGAGESVLGVAGEKEDFQVGARGLELLNEFVAAEAGHDNVCDD